MTVAELKIEFEEKCKSNTNLELHKIETGLNFISYQFEDNNKVYIKNTDEIIWNMMVVEVSDNFSHGVYFEDECWKLALDLIKESIDYWKQYSLWKGLDGIIVVCSRYMPAYLSFLIQNTFDKQDSEVHHFIKEYVSANTKDTSNEYIGGYFKQELLSKIKKFTVVQTILDELLDENMLLIPVSENAEKEIRNMFHGKTMNFLYHTQSVNFEWLSEVGKIFISTETNTNLSETVLVEKELIQKKLDEIAVENRVKTLIKPPMDNFSMLMDKVAPLGVDKEQYPILFDRMVTEFGNWEEVEKEFGMLLKDTNYMNVYDIKDNNNHQKIIVTRINTDNFFYFIVIKNKEKESQELAIFRSLGSKCCEMEAFVSNLLFEN